MTYINHVSRFDKDSLIQVTPDEVENGGNVTVLWSHIQNPSHQDIIAYYCPIYESSNHFLDFFPVNVSASWQAGYGHFTAPVYNMRTICQFKYFRYKRTSFVLAAVSNELSFTVGGQLAPLHGHLSLTGKSTEMRVLWNSGEGDFFFFHYIYCIYISK